MYPPTAASQRGALVPASTASALFLSARRVEDIELLYPWHRLREEGIGTTLVSPDGGAVHGLRGHVIPVDGAVSSVDAADHDALIVPGGFAPDALRTDQASLDLVREFDRAGKPIALICHAGWVGISAGIVKGRRLTGYRAIKDDLVNAGAEWLDEATVVDGNLITARDPQDMGVWCRAILAALAGGDTDPG